MRPTPVGSRCSFVRQNKCLVHHDGYKYHDALQSHLLEGKALMYDGITEANFTSKPRKMQFDNFIGNEFPKKQS